MKPTICLLLFSLIITTSCRSEKKVESNTHSDFLYMSVNKFNQENCKCSIKTKKGGDAITIYQFGVDIKGIFKGGTCQDSCYKALRDEKRQSEAKEALFDTINRFPEKLDQFEIDDVSKICWKAKLRSVPTKKNGKKERSWKLRYTDYKLNSIYERKIRSCPDDWTLYKTSHRRYCHKTYSKNDDYDNIHVSISRSGRGYVIRVNSDQGGFLDYVNTAPYQSKDLVNKTPETKWMSHGESVSFDADQVAHLGGERACVSLDSFFN